MKIRPFLLPVALLLLMSFFVKWHFSQYIIFDFDIVPVVSLGWQWLHGLGDFPVYGTLSSVAAYNLPGLVWLHLPALIIVDDPRLAIIITLTFFNLVGTCATFRLGTRLFSPSVGFASAILFTFCDTSLAGSTIAWAQLLLPTFFVLVLLCLWEWKWTGQGAWLAWSGIIATFAFMVHFSAIILFPLMLIFAVFTRPQWRWRGLIAGALVCFALLAPYLLFQSTRDFRDFRAFLQRSPQVAVPELPRENPQETMPQIPLSVPSPADEPTPPRNFIERALGIVARVPNEIIFLFTQLTLYANRIGEQTPFYGLNIGLYAIVLISLVMGMGLAGWRIFQIWKHGLDWRVFYTQAEGRITLIFALILLALGFMIVLRVSPIQQPSYIFGFQSWVIVLNVWSLQKIFSFVQSHFAKVKPVFVLYVFISVYAVVCVFTRDVRYRENTTFFPQVWYYTQLQEVVAWIANDWNKSENPQIAYDILPEQPDMKWVVAWNTVSSDYRMGMSYDFILSVYHSQNNANQSADGFATMPDYIVIYDVGLERYDTTQYEVQSFGRIRVLQPR